MLVSRVIGGAKIPCIVFYIIIVLVIIAYGAYIRLSGAADILEKKVIDHPSCPGFDGWAVTHFLFWGFLGFVYPNHYLQALSVSFIWEGIEHALGQTNISVGGSRLQLVGDQDDDGRATDAADAYWYGRFISDPLFNIAGYIIGSEMGNRMWPQRSALT